MIALATLAFWAPAALGAWVTQPGGTVSGPTTLLPGMTVFWEVDASTSPAQPDVLDTRGCTGGVAYEVEPDVDGSNAGLLVQWYRGMQATWSATAFSEVWNHDANGQLLKEPLDGVSDWLRGNTGVFASFLAARIEANPLAEDGRLAVACQ